MLTIISLQYEVCAKSVFIQLYCYRVYVLQGAFRRDTPIGDNPGTPYSIRRLVIASGSRLTEKGPRDEEDEEEDGHVVSYFFNLLSVRRRYYTFLGSVHELQYPDAATDDQVYRTERKMGTVFDVHNA